MRIALLGRHQVYPILAALAVAAAGSVPLDDALRRLTAVRPVVGRMQVVPLKNGAYLVRDEYKGSVETIDAALDTLAEIGRASDRCAGGRLRADRRHGADLSAPRRHRGDRRARHLRDEKCDRALGGSEAGWDASDQHRSGGPERPVGGRGDRDLSPDDVILIKGRDTQRLERIALAVMGRTVRCEREYCSLRIPCDECHLLAGLEPTLERIAVGAVRGVRRGRVL